MNLPENMWRSKVQFVSELVRPVVERFLQNIDLHVTHGHGLLVSGAPGIGKTGVAALVAKEARCRGYSAFFITVWDLREAVRSRIEFDEDMSVLERCREVDVLVLDGLRSDDAKDPFFGARAIEELVAGRGVRKKMTVVTTQMGKNLLWQEFRSFMNSTRGTLAVFVMDGPDLRQNQEKALESVVLGRG
jgi:DNA replication protein DnaC